jgi:hypothetical protein
MMATDLVTLKSGLVLPLAAVKLALDLEDRGFRFAVADGRLFVSPRARLVDADREQIRQWLPALVAIASYDADAGDIQ